MDIQSILQVLFPYLVGLYFIDCITHIGRHHHIFVSSFGNRYKLRTSGFRLAGLSPLSRAVDSHNLPLILTREGLYILANMHVAQNTTWERNDLHFIPYGELHTVKADGKTIRINGTFSLKAPSPVFARDLAGQVLDLMDAEPQDRERVQRSVLEKKTDMGKLESMRADYAKALFSFGLLCSILFFCTFIILPPALYLGVDISVPLLLFFMAPMYFIVVGKMYLFHRRFYRSSGEERVYLLLTVLLLPVSALHVISRLTREMYSSFDSLAVAALLLPKDMLQSLLRKELKRIHYAKNGDFPSDLKAYWIAREETLRRLVTRSGFDVEEMFREPARMDRFADKYCPLCDAEYRVGFHICSDCAVDLKEFQKG
jgi:hypothetical protein